MSLSARPAASVALSGHDVDMSRADALLRTLRFTSQGQAQEAGDTPGMMRHCRTHANYDAPASARLGSSRRASF